MKRWPRGRGRFPLSQAGCPLKDGAGVGSADGQNLFLESHGWDKALRDQLKELRELQIYAG